MIWHLIPLPTSDLSAVERWAVFLVAVSAGVVALGSIARRIRSAYRRVKGWVREFIRRADALDKLVQHELQPNSGGSLHDTVHKNSARLTELERHVATMAEAQPAMWHAIEAVANATPTPTHHEESTP